MAKAVKKNILQDRQAERLAKGSFSESPYFWHYVIFAFAFLLFFNSISNEYAMDDELVTINHRLTSKGIAAIPEIFTSPYYEDAAGYSFEYRPVVLASFAIEHSLFGENPHVSHFWNVLLYALSCVLLFHVLKGLFRDYSVYLAVGASLLFAAHTAHTEVVCNIKCRDEILALFFSLLTLQCSLNAITKSWKWLLLVTAVFTLALMSKISVMPFVMLIPILMILFTSVRLWQVVAITFAMSLPSFFFIINVRSTDVKVIMLVACFLVNVTFWALVNYKELIYHLKAIYYRAPEQADTDYSINLKTFFQEFLPEKSFFHLSAILPVLLLLGAYFLGIYMEARYLSVAVIVLLVGGCFFVKKQYKIWFLAGFLMTVGVLFAPTEEWNLILELLFLFLAFFFLYGGKGYRLPITLFIIFFLLRSKDWGNVGSLLVFLFFMYALRSRFSIMALVTGIMLVAIVDVSTYIEDRSWSIDWMGMAIVYAFLIIYFKKDQRLVLYPLLLIVSGMTIFNILNYQEAVQYAPLLGETVNTDFIPAGSNRILDFPEQCVQNDDPWQVRAGTSLTILWHYLCKVIIPYPLAYYYGYKFVEPTIITEPLPIITLLLHALLCFVALWALFRKEKLLTAGILTYLITIVIFSNYFAPIPGMVGDRFLLVPSLGWILVMLFLLSKVFKINFSDTTLRFAKIPKGAQYVFGAALLFYSGLSFARNFDWHDAYTLYSHDISYVENSAQAHNLLALTCLKNANVATTDADRLKLYEEGIHHLKRAVTIYPNFFNPTFDLGRAYGNMGQWDSAKYYFDRTIALNDSFTDALYAVGDMLRQQGKYEEAKPYFAKTIRYVPNEYIYYDKLSFIYFLQKQYDTAIAINRQAMVAVPNDSRPYYAIARIYFMEGKRDSSIIYLNKVFEKDPANALGLQLKAEMGLP